MERKIPLLALGTDTLKPSFLVRRFAPQIADATAAKPVLDVACGSGRNAVVLAQLGCRVTCVDKDLTSLQAHRIRLRRTSLKHSVARIRLHQMDLDEDPWPFAACAFGGIINVHFLLPALFPHFENSLSPGGYLLIETVPGCGGNYLELPKAGVLRAAFENAFDIEFYKERVVGPCGYGSVAVQMFGRRKDATSSSCQR